ncbi:hypothetical protein M407DRAFT_41813, partial [Tulasnella calospora MUT 4182]
GFFRCTQCFGRPLLCAPCLLDAHRHSPFHWPEQWVDKTYELWEQLLEVDIWPATHKRPQTGFTMELLRHQRCFNLRSKTSLKEYYDALIDLTSGTEDKGLVSSVYDQLRVSHREHRVLGMHMRAGRPDATAPICNGELCVACPTCPQPGVNLPNNWERDP